jgi:hypothetical protein
MSTTSTEQPSSDTVLVTRAMVHQLMNHLCIALGNSELLTMDLRPDDPERESLLEIRDACARAVDFVKSWAPASTQ